ncbi:nucleotidyltransferase domain-containing protein [Nodosilinea sp. P-1105]|uniref:nucleotidyltransferase family protein n=1 Tax=Nodosilinea sp. P-1105 TaxID=2546229 RepID=UPI00146C711E|nr:nucleotidyltransferase domain-containing protein [Nodosilinea sp. P-1105]NMF86509.1 nucleotidyltransferase domain-containing protein [Nodosilinea sp. P-1105]
MPYGLLDSDLQHIADAIQTFDQIAEVVLFGSRAKGNYKPGSDVDLAIKGDRVTPRTVAALADCLNEEKPLPYFFDMVHYDSLDCAQLKDHIDRVGIVIFPSPFSAA